MHYIVSDIHGCFYTLEKLIDKIRRKDEDPQFVFVGDYVDRGVKSKECVEYVMQLQSEGAICLRGNHDDVIDYLLHGISVTDMKEMLPSHVEITPATVGLWWTVNGLFPTMQSYVQMPLMGNTFPFALSMFISSVPQTHKDFFRGLKMYWENETHFACHAFLDPSVPLPRKLDFISSTSYHDMLWSRFSANEIESIVPGTVSSAGLSCQLPVWDKIGVFGHTPVGRYGAVAPIKHGNIRLIDTGACLGEYLTAYCCEQDDWLLQATDSRDRGGK